MQNLYQTTFQSPLGNLTLVAHDTALIGIQFDEQKFPSIPPTLSQDGRRVSHISSSNTPIDQTNPILDLATSWLTDYFSGKNPNPKLLPLDLRGTQFQLLVWQILITIPYGHVITYGAIAHQIAHQLNKPKMSAQAVGGAVGRNPIPLIVPCHRVVGVSGNLTGYAGGLNKKKFLLSLEGLDLNRFR